MLLTLIGVAIGLECALTFAGVLDSLLYGVSARGIRLPLSVWRRWQLVWLR
jgi:hypothetical protein